MQQATLEQWRELYRQADTFKEKKPWEIFADIDLVAVQLSEYREPFYCSIMGKQGNCLGISMYYGMQGFSDLMMIMDSYQYPTPTTYVMGDITCLTCYYGAYSELEDSHQKILQDLGLSYEGDQDWPYFYSFEPRYMPVNLNKEQVLQATKVMKVLNAVMEQVKTNPACLPAFDKGEYLMAKYDENDHLQTEALPLPYTMPRFMTVKVEERVLEEYKNLEKTDMELVLDMNYFFTPINDPDYDRPLNPLVVVAYDLKEDLILAGDVLSLDDDELDMIVSMFFYVLDRIGIPRRLYARNPRILLGMEYICEQLGVEMVVDALEEVDDIYAQMQENI